MFPKNFVWGVASSAYQIEGREENDGAGDCVWDEFCREGRVYEGQDAFVSCDHIHRYKEDFALMRLLGIEHYRFSLSWARLMPQGTGSVNEKGIALYRDMILEMKKNGITPYITMFHWELPQALQDQGGWLNETSIQWFADYARVVAENFSDLCEYFITFNEPQCFIGLGNLTGVHAPGIKMPITDTFQMVHNMLRAHGAAVKELRAHAKQQIKIGYAPTCGVACPVSKRPEDVEAARSVYFGLDNPIDNWTWNVSWFSDPVFLGKYPEEGLKKYAAYLPEITPEDLELISQPLDFMGQNIYNGYAVRAGGNGEPEYVKRKLGAVKTAAQWPVTPECLYWGMKFLYERYKTPIYITENGMSCHDTVSADGRVHDQNRIDFLDSYLGELSKACAEGIEVRGYFQWTFLDNFEWEKGYNERFGMVHVDFTTQKRMVKDSAYWYQQVIETNGGCLTINQPNREIFYIDPPFTHNISELWKEQPQLFRNVDRNVFPLLIKIITAKTKEERSDMIHQERWSELIREIPVKKGDFIQIAPGTVPAKSVEDSIIDTIHLPKDELYKLYECQYYKVFKLDVEHKAVFEQSYPFLLLSVLEGDGLLNGELVKKGDHLILPACAGKIEVQGKLKAICFTL